jgi:carbonic anhydrase/acetyltransferase-like protein (isoleucine patch superfamily)
LPILPFGDKTPKIDTKAYVSPQATIVGDVEIGAQASIWPGAVIRGDQASVRIGESSCIQDSVVIHAHTEDNPAIIGSLTIVGTASVRLAPGSIVPANVVIPPRSANSGAPAAQIRDLSRDEVEKQSARAETIAQVFQKLRIWQQLV